MGRAHDMSDVTAQAAKVAAEHTRVLLDAGTAVAQAAVYGGAGATVAANALSLPDIAAIVSMCVAVAGFCLQLYLAIRKLRHDRLVELHYELMNATEGEGENDNTPEPRPDQLTG